MKLKENIGMSLIIFTIILAVVAIGVVYLLNNPNVVKNTSNGQENNLVNNESIVNKNEIETGKEENSDIENKEDIMIEKLYTYKENGKYTITYTKKDKNNKVVWTYQTKEQYVTELERIELLTIVENKVYINEGGTIIALNKDTGKVIWENFDYKGASSCFCVDSENKLYIAGYYKPFLCIIDENGKTIKRIESFGDEYFWPVELELKNNNELVINCTIENRDEAVLVVNLKDYSTKIENTKK